MCRRKSFDLSTTLPLTDDFHHQPWHEMSYLLDQSHSLRDIVQSKFTEARRANHVVFSETEVALLNSEGEVFQLRYCPALAKKPKKSDDSSDSTEKKFNPFEDPSQELLVARVPAIAPTHNIVLNKYPVIKK